MKKLSFTITLFSIFFIGCDHIPVLPISNSKIDTININLDLREPYYLGEAIDSIKYIKLGNSGKDVLTDIRKLVFYDNCVYVLDKTLNKSIYRFSIDGKFLSKSGTQFDSNSVPSNIRNFHIFKKRIITYDDHLGIIKFFDLDGSFLKKISIGLKGCDFIILDENLFVFYSRGFHNEIKDNLNCLFFLDSAGRLKSKGFPVQVSSEANPHVNENVFFYYNNESYFLPSLQNNLYTLSNEKIEQVASFNFGRFNLSQDVLTRNLNLNNFNDFPYVTEISRVLQTNHYTQIAFSVKGNEGCAFYDRRTGKLITSGVNVLADETSDFNSPVPITVYNNYFVSIVYPSRMLEIKKYYQSNISRYVKTNRWKSRLDSIGINQNPVLMLYTIKKI